MFIDGQWLTSGPTFDSFNPATGERIDSVADATKDDALAAIDAAHRAFPGWRETTAYHRSTLLYRAWELMRKRRERSWRN